MIVGLANGYRHDQFNPNAQYLNRISLLLANIVFAPDDDCTGKNNQKHAGEQFINGKLTKKDPAKNKCAYDRKIAEGR